MNREPILACSSLMSFKCPTCWTAGEVAMSCCKHVPELEAEVDRLRAELASLRSDQEALLRAARAKAFEEAAFVASSTPGECDEVAAEIRAVAKDRP